MNPKFEQFIVMPFDSSDLSSGLSNCFYGTELKYQGFISIRTASIPAPVNSKLLKRWASTREELIIVASEIITSPCSESARVAPVSKLNSMTLLCN